MSASDLTQSGPALLFNLVNTANPSLHNGPLSAANVTIGVPQAPASGHTENTDIVLTAIAGQGYTGSVTLNYNRVDITTVITDYNTAHSTGAGADAVLTGTSGYVNASDMLAALNTKYSLDLQASDIVDGAIGTATRPTNYTLVMAAGSLTYINQLVVTLEA